MRIMSSCDGMAASTTRARLLLSGPNEARCRSTAPTDIGCHRADDVLPASDPSVRDAEECGRPRERPPSRPASRGARDRRERPGRGRRRPSQRRARGAPGRHLRRSASGRQGNRKCPRARSGPTGTRTQQPRPAGRKAHVVSLARCLRAHDRHLAGVDVQAVALMMGHKTPQRALHRTGRRAPRKEASGSWPSKSDR